VRQRLVGDPHQRRRFVGVTLGNRRDAGNRLAQIAHHRVARLLDPRVAQLRGQELPVEHVHRAHAGVALRGRSVDLQDFPVGNGADDAPGVEHAGQLDVEGVAGAAGHLLDRVEPRHPPADYSQGRVLAERRRLVYRHLAADPAHALADDAVGDLLVAKRT
jgi:hypothetical protein